MMKQKMAELVNHAMDSLGAAVTIIDPRGVLLYYNHHAAKILDRKPEYLGKEIFELHRKTKSNDMIKSMLQEFQRGRKGAFKYQAKPYGKVIYVTVSPIIVDNKFIGCVQCVIPKENNDSGQQP